MSQFTLDDENIVHPHSPGIVDKNEVLLRLQFKPENIDSKGDIIPKSINKKDLLSRGYSIFRQAHANAARIEERANIQSQNPNKAQERLESFLSHFTCSQVRELKFDKLVPEVEGQRAALIIDEVVKDPETATQETIDTAHAAIYCSLPDDKHIVWLRNKLASGVLHQYSPLHSYLENLPNQVVANQS